MRRARVLLLSVAVAGVVAWGAGPPDSRRYDLLVRHGRIVDGTGSPWFRGDIAVSGDRIAAIGRRIDVEAARVIDAAERVVSPGFIDIHTHARRGIFEVPTAPNYVRQGVTTIIEGLDGSSPVPLGPLLERVVQTRIVPNFGSFIGQGSVRSAVIGDKNRAATPGEVARMSALVERGMQDGAFGLSTGLLYVPGSFTPTAEIVELARIAARYGGIHTSHMRDEAAGVIDSVRETIDIGERGGLPTQITHHKIVGVPNRGRSVDTLRLVAEARRRGVDATIDQYPYTASSAGLDALFPRWALEGSARESSARLQDPEIRARIQTGVLHALQYERGGGDPEKVSIASCAWDPSLDGKTLADILRGRRQPATLDAAADLVVAIVARGNAQAIFHALDEADLERILVSPYTMIASDGEIPVFGRAFPHPRSYGTFARVLARYVRERRLLSLEEAVRKMTSFPAARLGIADRGLLKPGMRADLVIWDPEHVQDRATFEKPHQYAEGFVTVIVNGQVVFEHGAMTEARPGRVLYGPGRAP